MKETPFLSTFSPPTTQYLPPDAMYALTPQQVKIVWGATLGAAALSLFCASFMLITIFLFGKRRGMSKLINYLALGDWGWSLTVCISHIILFTDTDIYTPNVCKTFRLFFQFFGGSTVFWTTCISVYLYKCVFHPPVTNNTSGNIIQTSDQQETQERKTFLIFHLISWGVPLIFVIILLWKKEIVQDHSLHLCFPTMWPHFTMWFLPICICFASCVIVYILLMFKLRSMMSWRFIFQGFREQTLALPFRISLYLLVFFTCWGLDITQYIIVSAHGEDTVFGPRMFALVVTYNILLQSQGTLDLLIYGVANKEVRKNYSGKKILSILIFLLSPILVIPCMIRPIRHYFCGSLIRAKYQNLDAYPE